VLQLIKEDLRVCIFHLIANENKKENLFVYCIYCLFTSANCVNRCRSSGGLPRLAGYSQSERTNQSN
jgi:hypothetical protein